MLHESTVRECGTQNEYGILYSVLYRIILLYYMKGPNPKSGICNDFVKVAFSVIEALKNTQIDTY